MIWRRLFGSSTPAPDQNLPPLDPRVIDAGIDQVSQLLTAHWETHGPGEMIGVIAPGTAGDSSWVMVDLGHEWVRAIASTVVGRGPLTDPEVDALAALGYEVRGETPFGMGEHIAYGVICASADDPEAIRAVAALAVRALEQVYRPHFPKPWDPHGRWDILPLG